MIRKATADDIDTIIAYALRFHAASPWAEVEFDADAFSEFALRLMAGGVIFLSDEGMIGGLISPLYFNPAVIVAAEMFWWAPSDGRALRQAFEAWAEEIGAQFIQFGALANERAPVIDRLYRRAGYRAVETGYCKRVAT